MATVFSTNGLIQYNQKALDGEIMVNRVVIEDYSAVADQARRFTAQADSAGPQFALGDANRYDYTGAMVIDISSVGASVLLPLAITTDAQEYSAWAVFIYIEGELANSEELFIIQADAAATQFVKAANIDVLTSIAWILGQDAPSALTVSHDITVGSFTPADASDTVKGVMRIATQPEFNAGSLTLAAVPSRIMHWVLNTVQIPAARIIGLLAPGNIPNISANKVTTDVFNSARLGTGSANDLTVLYGDLEWRTMPRYWYGTRAAYDAITNKSDNVEYNIHE